jgi:hydrogenase-4 membrane subunit HyfE
MNASIRPIAKFLYGFFAAVFLIVGATVLLLRTDLLPAAVRSIVMNVAHDDMNTAHLIQEFGSMLVFAGLISVWFIRHYEQSKFYHWAMTTFWALFSLAHWFYVGGPLKSVSGPMINTIPFVLFAIVGLLRKSSEER